jgi:two-component sensor histidine kinase
MLQSDRMPSEAGRELLAESVLRVRSVALIHEQLYGVKSLDRIDLGKYARALASGLGATLAPTVRVHVDAGVTEITINQAIPLGLILNELLTNAFKYGMASPGKPARERRTGEDCDVRVEIVAEGDQVRMAVTDSGDGLPDGVDAADASSLGLTLIRALARQLRGTLAHDVDRGTRFIVTCPRSTPD